MKKYDVIAIGDANIDLVVVGCTDLPLPGQELFVDNMHIHVGGGAALFTLTLAKLGLKTTFNGVLGHDYYGQYIMDQFSNSGIDTSYIKISESNNTGISIAINPENDRSFITYSGTNSEINLGTLDMASIPLGRHVHLTGYKGSRNHDEFMDTVKKIKSYGVTISCDVGWDDTGEWYKGINELMYHCDVFFINETEAIHYAGCSTIVESIEVLSKHCNHLVVKLGSKGAATLREGALTYRSGYSVHVVDTTGAGDSFNGGYIYGFLQGKTMEECLQYGNACGALSVTSYGGNSGIPHKEAIEAMIAEQAENVTGQWNEAGGS